MDGIRGPAQTASFRNMQGAATYRAQQQILISEGRYLDAVKMDVDNVRALFGPKDDGAIQQMGESIRGSQ